jgi:hypothetical protein
MTKDEFTFCWRGTPAGQDNTAWTVVTRDGNRSRYGHVKARTWIFRTREEACAKAAEALAGGVLIDTFRAAWPG